MSCSSLLTTFDKQRTWEEAFRSQRENKFISIFRCTLTTVSLETFTLYCSVSCGCCMCCMEKRSSIWVSLLCLGSPDRIISVNVEDHVNKYADWLLLYGKPLKSWCQLLQQMFSDRLLSSGLQSIIRARGCEIMSAAVILFWCSLASDDMLVALSDPSTKARVQGRIPRGLLSISFIFNVLFSAITIISAINLRILLSCLSCFVHLSSLRDRQMFNFKVLKVVV